MRRSAATALSAAALKTIAALVVGGDVADVRWTRCRMGGSDVVYRPSVNNDYNTCSEGVPQARRRHSVPCALFIGLPHMRSGAQAMLALTPMGGRSTRRWAPIRHRPAMKAARGGWRGLRELLDEQCRVAMVATSTAIAGSIGRARAGALCCVIR